MRKPSMARIAGEWTLALGAVGLWVSITIGVPVFIFYATIHFIVKFW